VHQMLAVSSEDRKRNERTAEHLLCICESVFVLCVCVCVHPCPFVTSTAAAR